MDVASYEIILDHAESGSFTVVHNTADESSTVVLDSLPAGTYTITIRGFNKPDAEGDQVAYLQQRETGQGVLVRNIVASVVRSTVKTIYADMVPYIDGTGALQFSLDLSQIDEELLQNNPRVIVSLAHVGGQDLSEKTGDESITVSLPPQECSDCVSYDDKDLIITLSPSEAVPQDRLFIIEKLPAGWYELTVELQSDVGLEGYPVSNWKRVYFARIMESDSLPTSGTVTVYSSMLNTGSIDLIIHENTEPMLVTMYHDDVSVSGNAEDDANQISVMEGDEVTLDVDVQKFIMGELTHLTEGLSYVWFLNGEKLDDNDSTLSITLTESGMYAVTVLVVHEDGWQNNAVGAAVTTIQVSY